MHAARKLAFNPLSRLSGVAADDEAQGPRRAARVLHRPHERAADAGNGFMVQRVFSGFTAHAVSAKQSMGHSYSEGLRPSGPPTRSLASRFAGLASVRVARFAALARVIGRAAVPRRAAVDSDGAKAARSLASRIT